MQNSGAGVTEETLTRAFALILVSFSYSGEKTHHIFTIQAFYVHKHISGLVQYF